MFCSQCGVANADGAKFCSSCGIKLGGAEAAPAPEAPAPASSRYQTIGSHATVVRGHGQREESLLALQSVFNQRYNIKNLIGRGGMGEVYSAHDTILDEPVALKVLIPGLEQSPEAVERFTREARIAMRLTHKNIVRVYDMFVVDGLRCISMEFIDGVNLRELLQKRQRSQKPLTLKEVIQVGRSVCEAMETAHEVTVHRDLKPENILVTKQGHVKVSDFGVALFSAPNTPQMTSSSIGTAYYMAPEQSSPGGKIDKRADIYSLGVILYEMLVGQVPMGRFSNPRVARPEIPERIDEAIMSALDMDPQKRPQSMRAFLNQLIESATPAPPAQPAQPAPQPVAAPAMPPPPAQPTQQLTAQAQALLESGKQLAAAKSHAEALTKLEQACQLNPNLAEAWYQRALAFSNSKFGDQGKIALERMLRGEITQQDITGMQQELLSFFKRAFELEPTNGMYQLTLTLVEAQLKQNQQNVLPVSNAPAQAGQASGGLLGRFFGGAGSNAQGLVNEGNMLVNAGQYPQAVQKFEQAIRQDANCAAAWYGKGVALAKSLGNDQAEIFGKIARGQLTIEQVQRIGGDAQNAIHRAAQLEPGNIQYQLAAKSAGTKA